MALKLHPDDVRHSLAEKQIFLILVSTQLEPAHAESATKGAYIRYKFWKKKSRKVRLEKAVEETELGVSLDYMRLKYPEKSDWLDEMEAEHKAKVKAAAKAAKAEARLAARLAAVKKTKGTA